MEDWHIPSLPGALPAAERVLVLAPHPDDEVFGCGGVLALYAARGVHVKVVVVSDGAAQVTAQEREFHFAQRAAESRAALACLGVTDVEFWGLPDRSLGVTESLRERITRAIEQAQPEVVLAPSLWEVHPDHVVVGRTLIEVLSNMTGAGDSVHRVPTALLYEVGSAQRVNLLIDIGDVWDAKQRAMACFVSQQARQDYARHISALNVWRTYTLPSDVRQAEGLLYITASDVSSIASGNAPGAISQLLAWMRDSALVRAAAQQEQMQVQLAKEQEQIQVQLAKEREALRNSLDEFHAAMAQRDASIHTLQSEQRHRDAVIAQLQSDMARIKQSLAWRMTAPLRWAGRWLNRRR